LPDSLEIPKRGRGRPKGVKNVKPPTPKTTTEGLEALMQDTYSEAKKARGREKREWIRLYGYLCQVQTLGEARKSLDATIGLKAALEEFYGVPKEGTNDAHS